MKKQLRVVFAGTPDNAAATLEYLDRVGIQIVGVLTRNDSIVGRSKERMATPVAMMASQLGLPVFKANSMDGPTVNWLRSLDADIGVVVAYGTIFREQELNLPRLGWLNLHYSVLPEFPGPAPVQHALLQGKKSTGVTVFRLDEGIDTGPIVASEQTDISELDITSSLLSKLATSGSRLLSGVLEQGEAMIVAARTQQGIGNFPSATKPTRELAKLDFSQDAQVQLNKIRAMNPEPMAWFEYKDAPVRVIRASYLPGTPSEVSQARIVDKKLVVDCKGGSLILEILQPAGKQEMTGPDWFRGLRVQNLKLS